MPYADTAAMQAFLDRFSETIADGEDAVMILDQEAGMAPMRLPFRPTSPWSRCPPTRPN